MVPEPQRNEADAQKPAVSDLVTRMMLVEAVVSTVDLDSHAGLQACKIENISRERNLAANMHALRPQLP